MDWPDERCDEFKRMLAEHLRYSEIAVALGLTRNACIGKAHRLGLTNGRPRAIWRDDTPKEPKPKPHRTKRLVRTISPNHFHLIETPEMPMRDIPPEQIPIAQRKQLQQLGFLDCRWPYGEPGKADFFFCGGQRFHSSAYCAAHARIAYAKAHALSVQRNRLCGAQRRFVAPMKVSAGDRTAHDPPSHRDIGGR